MAGIVRTIYRDLAPQRNVILSASNYWSPEVSSWGWAAQKILDTRLAPRDDYSFSTSLCCEQVWCADDSRRRVIYGIFKEGNEFL